ncbi:hypothetical protein [Streptomyces sp. NPDC001530]|uniref:hypothetical protein n=1 Tax=Streptomyces sp. NPDC001530 TaxID=3364582 RepID=UPI003690E2A6
MQVPEGRDERQRSDSPPLPAADTRQRRPARTATATATLDEQGIATGWSDGARRLWHLGGRLPRFGKQPSEPQQGDVGEAAGQLAGVGQQHDFAFRGVGS